MTCNRDKNSMKGKDVLPLHGGIPLHVCIEEYHCR